MMSEKGCPPQLTDEQKHKATEMRREGKDYKFISAALGLDVKLLQYRLPQHLRLVCPELLCKKQKAKKPLVENRLTAADLKNYKHNDNSRRLEPHGDKVLIKVDINSDINKITEPIVPLAEGPKGDRMGVIIGRKWDERPKLFVEGKQIFANKMYKTIKNVNGKCSHGR